MGGTPITPPFMPGSVPGNPGVAPGGTQMSPEQLQKIAQILIQGGMKVPGASGSMTPISGAITPLAGPSGVGVGAPPAVAGASPLTASPSPQGAPPAPSGAGTPPAQPPNAMSGGSFSYPSGSAKSAAIVSTGIESMSQAIHTFKAEKDEKEFKQAQTTFQMYQKAAQVDPSTGKPVDPYTMSVLGNNPKLVRLWEKYITGELPRAPADPGGGTDKKGKPLPGKPMIPVNQPSPQDQLATLTAEQKLKQMQGGPTAVGELTNVEKHDALMVAAGLKPVAKDQRDLDKIDADIAKATQDAAEAKSRGELLSQQLADLQRQGPQADANLLADTNLKKAEAIRAMAAAEKDRQDLTKAKTQVQYDTVRKAADNVAAEANRELRQSQTTATSDRGVLRKTFGMGAAPSDEVDKKQARALAINDATATYKNSYEDILDGTVSAIDAWTAARRSANLTSTNEIWGGRPKDAPDPKPLPDGAKWNSPQGRTLGVVEGGKWVAP